MDKLQPQGGEGGARKIRLPEVLGIAFLAFLTVFFVVTSWRRWPDPLIDFGRELYLPWRLSNGAVLYRDADDFYGPLSQFFNAGLFRVFGPGLMVLVTANLVIFGGILAALYAIFRRGWGPGAAFVSSALFVSVFGFSQFNLIANYNYATPYSHEATHGMLVCLLLVITLGPWVEKPSRPRMAAAGLLFGLGAVLKPEVLVAAGLVTGAAVVLAARRRNFPGVAGAALWIGCAALPSTAFWAYFSAYFPWRHALSISCRGWLTVVASSRFISDPIQTSFLGFDHPLGHFAAQFWGTLLAGAFFFGLLGLCRLAGKAPGSAPRIGAAVLLLAAVAWVSWNRILWLATGRCVLGLVLAHLAFTAVRFFRKPDPAAGGSPRVTRLLTGILAVGLLARMLLNVRIYHYGFVQAALACVVVPAILIGEVPSLLRSNPRARTLFVAACVVLFGVGTVQLTALSQSFLRSRTLEVGRGRDRFYTFPPEVDPTGMIVRLLSDKLRQSPPGSTLLVLPEGEMINYLARMPSPVAPFFFFSAATANGLEGGIVRNLEKSPPDWVVVISRDLREYGVDRYGGRKGQGRELLEWVDSRYRRESVVGGDPLDPLQHGAVLLRLAR
jgi:hypothetical protein